MCRPVRARRWWRCGSGSCVDPARPDAVSGVCVAGAGVAACVAGTVDSSLCRRRRRSSACVAEEEDGGAWRRSAWRRTHRSGELVAHGDAERVLRKTTCVAGEDEEDRRVRAELMHAAWFASSMKAVVAAVATTTMGAAASTLATVSVRQPRRRRRGAPDSRRGAGVLYVRMGGDVVG